MTNPEIIERVRELPFGHEGKPMYIQGPYDDATRIVRTLRRSVSDGNFDYLCEVSP
jgi:hypothetical protein